MCSVVVCSALWWCAVCSVVGYCAVWCEVICSVVVYFVVLWGLVGSCVVWCAVICIVLWWWAVWLVTFHSLCNPPKVCSCQPSPEESLAVDCDQRES